MVRVFYRPDGGVAVMTFTHDDEKLKDRDTQRYLDENPGSIWEDVDREQLPQSRKFRNCWTKHVSGSGVDVHLGKAREQVMAEVRAKRDKDLVATDGPFLRAAEKGSVPADLAAQRQALRDLPAKVEKEIASLDVDALERYEV